MLEKFGIGLGIAIILVSIGYFIYLKVMSNPEYYRNLYAIKMTNLLDAIEKWTGDFEERYSSCPLEWADIKLFKQTCVKHD